MTIDWAFFVPILALAGTVAALSFAFLRPPSSSVTAVKRRLAALEADHESLSAKVERIKKRHYALEGHVYGSDDDDDLTELPDVAPAAPGGPNPTPTRDLALLPDTDFPEEAFQAELAKRRTRA